MKKLSNEDLMNYVDGTLDVARLAQIEEHLEASPEDAKLAADMKMALQALHEWDAAEPVQVSDDFWPALRDRLPEKPQRSWLRGTSAQVGEWLWPSHSPLRLSARIAVIAAFAAMAASFFLPQEARKEAVATPPLTSADKMFIQQSLDRHDAYVAVQPFTNPLSLPSGDGRNADGDDDDGEDDPYAP